MQNILNIPTVIEVSLMQIPKLINVMATTEGSTRSDISSTAGGQAAMLSLEAAADALLDGQLDALVTAPIISTICMTGFAFPQPH